MQVSPARSSSKNGLSLLVDAAETIARARQSIDMLTRQIVDVELNAPTDQQIALTRTAIRGFVETVVGRMVAAIPGQRRIVLPGADIEGFCADPDLVAPAALNVQEWRLTRMLEASAGARDGPVAAPIAKTADPALVRESDRAQSLRRDAIGHPRLSPPDVDYRTLERLVWRVAAAVRDVLTVRTAAATEDVDEMLMRAARALLGPWRRRDTPVSVRLATQLLALDDDLAGLLAAALDRCEPRLFTALLATRLRIAEADVLVAMDQPERLAIFLRAAELAVGAAASILATLAPAMRTDDRKLAKIVAAYDALSIETATELVYQLRLNPHYQASISERRRDRQT